MPIYIVTLGKVDDVNGIRGQRLSPNACLDGADPAHEALASELAAYKGFNGCLRASVQRLDERRSTDTIPVHSFDCVEKLAPGEITFVDIDRSQSDWH